MTEFKENIYDASIKALTEGGVPLELADAASRVLAKDDGVARDLGRTEEDKIYIAAAMKAYWSNQKNAENEE